MRVKTPAYMMRARRLLCAAQELEAEEQAATAVALDAERGILELPTKMNNRGDWLIEGIYQEAAYKAGLRRLDALCGEGLSHFPRRANGTSYLMKESVVRALLTEREMKDLPGVELSGAQGDLKYLNLHQLLRLRVRNLNFKPMGPHAASAEALLEKLDALVWVAVGRQAVHGLEDLLDPLPIKHLGSLGLDVALIAAASATVPAPAQWVCWFGRRRFFFDLANFANFDGFPASETFPTAGVLEVEDRSHMDINTSNVHRKLELCIRHCHAPDQLAPQKKELAAATQEAAGFGANVNAPKVTLHYIERAMKYFNVIRKDHL